MKVIKKGVSLLDTPFLILIICCFPIVLFVRSGINQFGLIQFPTRNRYPIQFVIIEYTCGNYIICPVFFAVGAVFIFKFADSHAINRLAIFFIRCPSNTSSICLSYSYSALISSPVAGGKSARVRTLFIYSKASELLPSSIWHSA